MSNGDDRDLLNLLAKWQAFSELQQRAFEFLAAEAIAAGNEFEHSTDGATGILTRIGQFAGEGEAADLQSKTFAVVQQLQAADRSRQGLEQVASVLTTLRSQHASLAEFTRDAATLPDSTADFEAWVAALSDTVCLTDWRRRLTDALHGRPPSLPLCASDDDELF
jgi:hypothetical protein